jgi:hypothetical protein
MTEDDVIALRARVALLTGALAKIEEFTAVPPVLLAQATYTINLVHWAASATLALAARGGTDA